MKVSAKGDYACRALLDLALNYESVSPVHVTETAKRQGINLTYEGICNRAHEAAQM